MKRSGTKHTERNQKGAALILGALGMMLLAGLAVAGTLFLADFGQSGYYREKLSFICHMVALQAVKTASPFQARNNNASQMRLQVEATDLVNTLLREEGMPQAQDVRVQLEQDAVSVSFKVDGLALIGYGGLPTRINMIVSDRVLMADLQPPAVMSMNIGNLTLLLPAYGKFVAPFSNGHTSNIAAAPGGVAIFRNYERQYAQFNQTFAGNYSETLAGTAGF
jgi:hypothetical protein